MQYRQLIRIALLEGAKGMAGRGNDEFRIRMAAVPVLDEFTNLRVRLRIIPVTSPRI